MSSFAEDKVKKYIKNNLRNFYRIRVAQMLHLRCLTDIDRQEINACFNNNGNNRAVWEFFERLQCREGWLQILIEALREDNMGDLADDLQREYNMHLPRNVRPRPTPPAMGNVSSSVGTEALGFSPPASAERNPSPPCTLPNSGGAKPSQTEAQGAASSATEPAFPKASSYHTPVQETDLPSQNSKTTAEPEATHNAANLEPSTSPKNSTASPAGKEKPNNAQAPSTTGTSNLVLIQNTLQEMPVDALPGTPLREPSRSDSPGSTQKWDSHQQQRPVCVKNGYFGNANRVAVGAGLSSTLVAPLGPKTPGNHPVEDYYSSVDSSPSAPQSSQDDSQEEERLGEWKTRSPNAVSGNTVGADSSAFSLQRRLDARHGEAEDRRRISSTSTEEKEDGGETSEAVPVVGRPRNLQERGGHIPANAASWLASGSPRFGSSPSDPSQQPCGSSENLYTSPYPTTVLSKLGRPPPSDFEGSSSIDVIPPNSHREPSVALSGVDFEDLKSPVQEEKWHTRETDEMVSVTPVNSRKRCNGSSRDNRIFHSSCEDDCPSKPGILTSVPDVIASRQPSSGPETNPEYSGRSDRLCLSSLSRDPLMLSDSSQKEEECSGSAVGTSLGRNVMGGRGDASLQPMDGNQEAGGSVRTFEVQVERNPSIDLAGVYNEIGDWRSPPSQSPGAFPDPVAAHQPNTPSDSQPEDSCQNKGIDTRPPWIPNDSVLLLVGLALASVAVVALVAYKKK